MKAQNHSEDYWKEHLDKETYRVMREKGTDAPFLGKYVTHHQDGTYVCNACSQELFGSNTKFDSQTGWPSFTEPKNQESVTLQTDESHGMSRTEVLCSHCSGHLGHVFNDGPIENGGLRFCLNSTSLNFESKEEKT